MTSLWIATGPAIDTDPFESGARYDEVVVGAGLTGLTTALLLARAGRRVVVVEGRTVGAGATGNTTAKLSLLQGSHLQKIRSHNYRSVLQAYVDGNLAAQRWLLDFLDRAGVPVQHRAAISYAGSEDGVETVEKEYRVARSVGLPVERRMSTELPYPVHAAVALPDQAQFDPMDVLAALAAEFRSLGGRIHENSRVRSVKASDPVRVRTDRGELLGSHVILATGIPILDRGLYFAKVQPQRSYAQAYRVPGDIPQDMYLAVDAPSRSLRTAPSDDGELLLVGGAGHIVGRADSTAASVAELGEFTRRWFPGAERLHRWSAQDYQPAHRVPFTGWLPRGRGRVFLATGYDKWGMTNAVQSALTLTTDLLGDSPHWAKALRRRITTPRAFLTGAAANASVGWWIIKGWTQALTGGPASVPAEGGVVGRSGERLGEPGLRPTAVSAVGGTTCAVSAVCSHLGGIVRWNDAESSWDCPLHGSRFAADGEVLEGPATRPLRSVATRA